MIKITLQISKKFYNYQKERFPLIILTISLFPAILSSSAVITPHASFLTIGLALIASIAYLLHIRIIDEYRDFTHDNIHHTTRPVQTGLISKKELRIIDVWAVSILIFIAANAGLVAFIAVIIMLVYSYLAGKEFFISEKIRRYFFIHNAVNLAQMLMMQVFVYLVFANTFPLNKLTVLHFLFTSVGTLVFEFVRKIKIPGEDGSGKDTYSWYLGFDKALIVYQVLLFLNTFLFFSIGTLISPHTSALFLFAIGLVTLVSLSTLIHKVKKTKETDQLMQLALLLLYGIFNITIYFLILN